MEAGTIIAIVIGAIVLIALIAFISKRGRDRKLEMRRHEAHESRREAKVRGAKADRVQAEADERAARARQEAAAAEEQAALADKERRFARQHHERAIELDPDGDAESRNGNGAHREERSSRR
jgi:FtsZ-interacting cell division protein ZipA